MSINDYIWEKKYTSKCESRLPHRIFHPPPPPPSHLRLKNIYWSLNLKKNDSITHIIHFISLSDSMFKVDQHAVLNGLNHEDLAVK